MDIYINITAIEINPERPEILSQKCYNAIVGDFMAVDLPADFDAILMNPPFSTSADRTAWITHLRKAWELLNIGGTLVAILPGSFETYSMKGFAEFREDLLSMGWVEKVEAGAFKEAGTMVQTVVVVAEKTWREG